MQHIAIIGHGYVGKAVEHGFSTPQVEKHLIDPLYDTTVQSLQKQKIDVAFICTPTPMGQDGKIDASIVLEVVQQLAQCPVGIIAVKSTVTPDIIAQLAAQNEKIVYNPEFLTERNALADFINAPMLILGGKKEYTTRLQQFYENHSRCQPCPAYHMSAAEASFVKYGINTFLATKVVWLNQFRDLADKHGADYDTIVQAMRADSRIGQSHTQVPGLDGKRGYGGACFPKDTKALSWLAGDCLSILNEAIRANDDYREEK